MLQKATRFLKALIAQNKSFVTNYWLLGKGLKKQNFFTVYSEVHSNTAPVFVLSTGRCGTALLTQLFEADGNIDVNHARQPIMLHYSTVAHQLYGKEPEMLKRVIDACRTEMMTDTYIKGRHYIETNPYVTFFAYQLYELFPKSKFIHIIRHPGNFVRSTVSLNWYSGKRQYDMARIRPEGETDFDSWSNVRKAAWTWNEYNVFIDKFITSVNPERVLAITSESLFKDSETLNKVIAFSGAENISVKKVKSILAKPVNASKPLLPSYKDWEPQMKEELKREADKKLCDKFGYTL